MKTEQLWATPMAIHDLSGDCDLEQATTECLTVSNILRDKNNQPLKNWETPELLRIHEELIMPRIFTYLKENYGFEPTGVSVANWVFGGNNGGGLEPHIHAGSHFTAIFYPIDNNGNLVIVDPRFNAQRGYPRRILENHFAKRTLLPNAGQLVIIPSYVEHYVTGYGNGLRLSFVNDVTLTTESGNTDFD